MNNYLKQKGISATDFALEIGCSAGTIYRLMKMGSVTPEIFDKIKKATGGLVTPWINKRGRKKGLVTKWENPILDHSKLLEYRIWFRMMEKCYNKKFCEYRNYGEKGITVCDKWHKFEAFFEDMKNIPIGMRSLILDPLKNEFNKKTASWSVDARKIRAQKMGELAFKSKKRPKRRKKEAQMSFDEIGNVI